MEVCSPEQDGCLNSTASLERELLRSNRELAQVRDSLCQREQLVQAWHRKFVEATGKAKDAESELAKLRAHHQEMDLARSCSSEKEESLSSRIDEEIATLSAKLAHTEARLAEEVRERRKAEAAYAAATATVAKEEAANLPAMTALQAEVQRMHLLLTAERAARSDSEAEITSSVVERDGLTRQVKRLVEELRFRKAAASAAASAAAAAASRSRLPSEAEQLLVKLQARARILQTENAALRSEAGSQRARLREVFETQAMAAEETRAQKVQAARARGEAAMLRLQIEETRRLRTLEMQTLVHKPCRAEEVQCKKPLNTSNGLTLRFSRVGGS